MIEIRKTISRPRINNRRGNETKLKRKKKGLTKGEKLKRNIPMSV